MFKRLGAALIVLLLACSYAFAQNKVQLCYTSITGTTVSCIDVSVANPLPVSASVSASISGFTAASTGTPISVTTGGVTGTLPAGAVVVATNVGATNGAYCALGASATTASQYIAPNGGWFAFTVGVATQLTCITSTSTTTVNMTGGAGLPTGTGGGSGAGGGGGGAITIASGAVASGAYSSGSIASGAYASGSIGSGAVASGAFASGSIASGAIAAGAQVDLLTMRGSKASGTAAANSILAGAVYTAAGITLTDGQQAALQFTSAGSLHTTVDNSNNNGQATMANSSPVVIASNQSANALWGQGATGAAPPANAQYLGVLGSGATGGFMVAPKTCDNYVFKHITSATDTLAVQGVASQTIYICGFHARAAGTATWFLENTASVNANCSSSNTQIAILNTEAANTGIVDRSPFWSGLKNTSGNGLCINSTGTGGVDVGIYYAQF